jgi:hypothetical protein
MTKADLRPHPKLSEFGGLFSNTIAHHDRRDHAGFIKINEGDIGAAKPAS